MAPPEPSASLYDRTLYLVNNAPRSVDFSVMARDCDISVSWISRFAAGKFEDPGVKKVECLFNYLTNVGIR